MSAPFPVALSTSVRAEIRPGVWVDARRAVWLEPERVLVVADLHWGYAASHRARGNLLPNWGDDEIERGLHDLLRDYQPTEMIWLGDVVHAAEGAARAEQFLRQSAVAVTLIAGNHDRRWRGAGVRSASRRKYFFHHGDTTPSPPGGMIEVIGHHHPAVSWADGAGARFKVPALVASARRLVLPAFSPWAAGTPWEARETGETVWALAPQRIFALPRATLVPNVAAT
jgi:uncharacterized protein